MVTLYNQKGYGAVKLQYAADAPPGGTIRNWHTVLKGVCSFSAVEFCFCHIHRSVLLLVLDFHLGRVP